MFLAFASDATSGNFLIGVITGPKAVDIAAWMNDPNPANMLLSGIPIISFNSTVASLRNDQTAIWRIGTIHLTSTPTMKWMWNTSASRMPPMFQGITRSYQLGLCRSPAYVCRGVASGGFPLLDLLAPAMIGSFMITSCQLVNIVPVDLPGAIQFNHNNNDARINKDKRPRKDDHDSTQAKRERRQ